MSKHILPAVNPKVPSDGAEQWAGFQLRGLFPQSILLPLNQKGCACFKMKETILSILFLLVICPGVSAQSYRLPRDEGGRINFSEAAITPTTRDSMDSRINRWVRDNSDAIIFSTHSQFDTLNIYTRFIRYQGVATSEYGKPLYVGCNLKLIYTDYAYSINTNWIFINNHTLPHRYRIDGEVKNITMEQLEEFCWDANERLLALGKIADSLQSIDISALAPSRALKVTRDQGRTVKKLEKESKNLATLNSAYEAAIATFEWLLGSLSSALEGISE